MKNFYIISNYRERNKTVFVPAHDKIYLSQHMTKPTIRCATSENSDLPVHLGSLISAVWSEFLLMACAFYSLQAIQRRVNENPRHSMWMYRLIWVFVGQTGLIEGFVVCWLIYLDMRLSYVCWQYSQKIFENYTSAQIQSSDLSGLETRCKFHQLYFIEIKDLLAKLL